LKRRWPMTIAKVARAGRNRCLAGGEKRSRQAWTNCAPEWRVQVSFSSGAGTRPKKSCPIWRRTSAARWTRIVRSIRSFDRRFSLARMTARAVGKVLLEQVGYPTTELPSERTFRRVLNRLDYLVVFGTSRETSDFIVDCLQHWWDVRKSLYPHIRTLTD